MRWKRKNCGGKGRKRGEEVKEEGSRGDGGGGGSSP